jgi:hypothetical protein
MRLASGFLLLCATLPAQTLDDGIMMGKGLLCAGYLYGHDRWDQYWEGTLQRSNGNIGTLTTQAHQIFGNYGITDRVNLIVHLPHIRTAASQGVLAGMSGWQDATVAAKWKFFDQPFTEKGSFRLIGGIGASLPMTNYTPDFLPLSIGLGSRRITGRLTAHFRAQKGWFLNAHSAYTRRDTVTLDRPFYFTEGRLTFSDQVPMPSVFDYAVSSGYIRGQLVLSGSFSEQRTLAGGDIRRQDMPFVSNRMNAARVGAWAKIPLPRHDDLSFVAGYSYVAGGRNVGQATTLTAGVMYLFNFRGSHTK